MNNSEITNIIDGKKIAQEICNEVKNEIENLGIQPKIVTILVGNNPASKVYVKNKQKKALSLGIDFKLVELEENIKEKELLEKIQTLNDDSEINGYIVQLPLPKHIDETNIIQAIDPKKDIDGFHPINQGNVVVGDHSLFTPCTPGGIMEIFKRENIELDGKIVTVIGTSNIVGKPIANLLKNAHATITTCNSKTKPEFLKQRTKESDIVIVAAGVPSLVKADMLGKNTIVIDVGINKKDSGGICGDADYENIITQGNGITPVPGGVGPITVAMLMRNALKAYKIQNKKK